MRKELLFLFLMTSMSVWAQVFTTAKSKLIDAEGQVFLIRGMNNPHAWFGEKAYQALDDIQAVGCNTIRIVWETKGKDSDLERIIQRCIELEMIPMVELHDVTGNTSGERLAEMASWYAEPERAKMLQKYERYLLLNIANEWGSNKTKADYWMTSYAQCIDIMRKAGYLTTLVIDAFLADLGLRLVQHGPGLQFGNLRILLLQGLLDLLLLFEDGDPELAGILLLQACNLIVFFHEGLLLLVELPVERLVRLGHRGFLFRILPGGHLGHAPADLSVEFRIPDLTDD